MISLVIRAVIPGPLSPLFGPWHFATTSICADAEYEDIAINTSKTMRRIIILSLRLNSYLNIRQRIRFRLAESLRLFAERIREVGGWISELGFECAAKSRRVFISHEKGNLAHRVLTFL